jgi:hypothetical protein
MGALWQSDEKKTAVPADSQSDVQMPKAPRPRHVVWRVLWLLALIVLVSLGFAVYSETRSSKWQAREFSRFAKDLSYSLEIGPSPAILYPGDGPFDKRLGYSSLAEFMPRLLKRDYLITQQTRFSPDLLAYTKRGFFVPYQEKIQSGLTITDCRGAPLYQFTYPQQLYSTFAAIPPVLVNSLLFIENRDLLAANEPLANPAVDWPRFIKAALSQATKMVGLPGQSAGGSTLATQLEKYRHDPVGQRKAAADDFRQCAGLSDRPRHAPGSAARGARLSQQRAAVCRAGSWRSARHGRRVAGLVWRRFRTHQSTAGHHRHRCENPGRARSGAA